jgi:hypothetical protein
MNAKTRAKLVRVNHKRNGGAYSTADLAKLLSCSERLIRAYLLNEVCIDSGYSPRRAGGKVDIELVRLMARAGIPQANIARQFAVSPSFISILLKKSEVER